MLLLLLLLLHLLLLLLNKSIVVDSGVHSLLLHAAIGNRTGAVMMRLRTPALRLGAAIGGSMSEMAAVTAFAISRSCKMNAFGFPAIDGIGTFAHHIVDVDEAAIGAVAVIR